MLRFMIALFAGTLAVVQTAEAIPDIAELSRGTVRVVSYIEDGLGTGTGFVVSDDGHIITNNHVVEGTEGLTVILSNSSEELPATLVAVSVAQDLALIRVQGLSIRPLNISTTLPQLGEDVWAIGFPGIADRLGGNNEPTSTKGELSKTFSGQWDGPMNQWIRIVQHSAPINPGNSGGPLFDDCGRVIGVNTEGSDSEIRRDEYGNIGIMAGAGVYFSSHIDETIAFLAQSGVTVKTTSEACVTSSAASADMNRGEVAALQKQIEAAKAEAARTGQSSISLIQTLEEELRQARQNAEEETQTFRTQAAGALILTSLAILLAILLALRKPRQQIIQMVESLTRRVSPVRQASPDRPGGLLKAGKSADMRIIVSYQDGQTPGQKTVILSQRDRNGFVIGRQASLCHLGLENMSLSKRHARLSLNDRGQIILQDLNSSNGTSIGSQRLAPFEDRPVSVGSSFLCGDVAVRIEAGSADAPGQVQGSGAERFSAPMSERSRRPEEMFKGPVKPLDGIVSHAQVAIIVFVLVTAVAAFAPLEAGIVRVIPLWWSGILVFRWTYRAMNNLRIMGCTTTISPPWTFLWHFIPIANFWMPFRGMAQIWRGYVHGAPIGEAQLPASMRIWWAAWLSGPLLTNVLSEMLAYQVLATGSDAIGQFSAARVIHILGCALYILAALLLLNIIKTVTTAQSALTLRT